MKKRSTTPPDTNEIQQKTDETPLGSRQLQQLIDAMASGFALHEIICDPHGNPVDYRFLEINASYERLTGLVAGEILGKTALEVLPGLEPFWIETYGRIALTGQPERFENYTQALDKTFSVVAYCPEPGKFATLFEDITERKQAEKELLRRNEDLALLDAINNSLNNAESLETVFDLISEKVKIIFNSFGSTVNLVNTGHTHLVMQNLTIPAWLVKSIEKLTGIHIPAIQHDLRSAHPYRHIFNTGRSQLITDPEGIQEFMKGFIACLTVTQKTRTRLEALIPSISKLVDRRSVMVVPLVSDNVIIGTLDIGSSDLYTEEDLLRLEAIAAGLTTAILRKQADDELSASENKYRSLFNSMTEGVAINELVLDENGNVVDYIILDVNPGFELNTAYKTKDAVGKRATELYQMTPEYITSWWQQHVDMDSTAYTELYHEPTQRWHAITTTLPVGNRFYTIFSDITGRKQTDQKLQESAGNMQAILDSNLESVFLIESDGTIVAANLGLAKRFGRNRDELIGSNTYDLVNKKVADHRRKFIDQVITSGKPVRFEDQRSDLTIENSIYPVLDEQGKVVRLAIYGRDVSERRKAEISLAESEERFRLMIENAPLGYQSLDIDGNFIHVNPAWLEILGYEREEVIGHWFGDFLVPEYRDAFRERFPIFKAAGQIYSEFKMLHKNGSTIFVAFEGRIGYNAAGGFKQTHCMLQDITEKRRAAEKLTRSESELKKAQAYAHVGSWIWNIKSGKLEWSDEMYNIFGISKDNFSGNLQEVVASAIHPEDRQKVEASNSSTVSAGKPIPLDYRILRPDGSQRVVWGEAGELEKDAEGNPTLLRGIVMDITDRKQAEEKQAQTYELLTNLASQVPGVIYQYRLYPDGSSAFPYSSPGIYSIYEVTPEQVREDATPVFGRLHPEDAGQVADLINESARTLDEFYCEFRVILPEQGLRWRWSQAHPARTADGGTLWHGIILDITERKQAENALHESEKHLKNSQQIAHLGSWQLDVATNQVLWTEELYHMYGFDPALPVPPYTEHMKLFTPASWERLSASIANTRETGIPYVLELETVKKDGSNGWMWVRGEVTKDPDGNTIGLWGAAQDITERKQAEESLRESEKKFHQMFDISPVGIVMVGLDKRFILCNHAFSNSLGYGTEELVGKRIDDVTLPEDSHIGMAEMKAIMKGEIAISQVHKRYIRKDGQVVWGEVTISLIRDSEGRAQYFLAIIQDITERKQAEGEIQRMAQMLDIAPNSITVHDLDGQFIFANQKTFDLHGYTRAEFMGLNLHHLDLPESEELIVKRMQDIMERGEATFEVRHYHKDGSILPMEVHARLTSWNDQKVLLSIATDIRERKQAEDALQKSRDLLNTTGKMAKVGGWEIDTSGSTLAWTEETFHIHELAPGSQPNVDNALNFYHPDDRMRVASAVEQAVTTGQPFDIETRLITALGNQIWVRSSGQAILQQGKITGVRGSIQDITDRKLAEETLQESEQRYRDRVAELETIMDIAPVALWIAQDSACHEIIGNRTANQLHRFEPDQNASMTPVEGQKPHPNIRRILHDGVEITPAELPLQVSASQGIEIRDFESQIFFKDDEFIHEIGNAKPLFDEKGRPRGAIGAFMDITGLKRGEEELRHRAKELDGLQKTVLDITTAQNLPGLLESIVERACLLLGAPGGLLYMNDIEKGEVRCDVSYNTPGNYAGVVLKYGEGVAGRVAQTGEPLYIDDYKNWTGRAHSFGLDRQFSVVLGVPLLWGGQVRGVIDVLYFEEGKSFNQEDIELLNIFAGHAAIAIENSRLLEASQAGQVEVRALSTRLAEAEENERRRIARELHDQVGQSLSALSINMNIMHSQVPEFLPGFKRRLDDSLMLIDQTTDHIRHLMSELRPAVLDDYGLKAALDWAVGSIAKRTNLKLLVEGGCNRFPPRIEIALFRIAQEALSNISRHAHARNVKILLIQDGPEMSMSITDDGIGFDPSSIQATEKSGWGLRLMAERAGSIGASLQVDSTPGVGTCITVRYHDDNSTGG